jgi:hypothetical protein
MKFLSSKENSMKSDTDNAKTPAPWNKGRLVGQKAPLKLKEIWAIRVRLQLAKKVRDLASFNPAIDSKLRGCDLVELRVCDIAQGKSILPRAIVMQRKTHWPVQFEITEQSRQSVGSGYSGARSTACRSVQLDQLAYACRTDRCRHVDEDN